MQPAQNSPVLKSNVFERKVDNQYNRHVDSLLGSFASARWRRQIRALGQF